MLGEVRGGPGALAVQHPVELEGEDAGLVGRGAAVRHADLLRLLLEVTCTGGQAGDR